MNKKVKLPKRRRGNPRIKELGIATRFKPGVSGNAGGRPRTRVLSEMLAAIGNERDGATGKTFFQLAAEELVKNAFAGDVAAFREFADRIDGRTTQSVELSGGLEMEHSRSKSDLEMEWQNATPEEREKMTRSAEDEILVLAEKIKAGRVDSEENRYRARMREFHNRVDGGEDVEQVIKTFRTPDVN